MKCIIIFILIFFLISSAHALPQLSEIRYLEGEFAEIIHDSSLNLSKKKIFDSSASDSFNTLEELSFIGSNISLIFGSRFANEINLSSLNCNLYQTQRSQLSNGGLKDTGEELHIEINESFNLSFFPEESLSFSQEESLHFSSNSSQTFIRNSSPCLISVQEQEIEVRINETTQNEEENTTVEIIESCNEFFSIEVEKNIFDNKLTFKHRTNASNFSISYWIEDFQGTLIKENRTTTNLNEKSFTPSFESSKAMQIVSELKTKSCFLRNSSLIFFKKEVLEKEEHCQFEILPEKDFFEEKIRFSFETDQEEFTIFYKIEDMKRNLVKEELETKNTKLKSFTPKDKTTALYKVIAELKSNSCNLKKQRVLAFHGEELESEIIYIDAGIKIEEQKEGIQSFFLEKNILIASLYIKEELFEKGSCKILRNTALLSEEKAFNAGTSLLSFEINETKLRKEKEKEQELSLRCSYIKEGRKTPIIFREYFNYSLEEEKQYEEIHEQSLSQTKKKREERLESQSEVEEKSYLSKGLAYKKYAPYGIIGALSLLLSGIFLRISI